MCGGADLAQAVEGADEEFVLQDAAESQIVEHDADEGKGCREAGGIGVVVTFSQVDAESQVEVVTHQEYHAQREQAHLQGTACEEENAEEGEGGDQHQQGKQRP